MFLLLAAAVMAPAVHTMPACAARDIVLETDAADGDFNGMSHSGTWLVLRNKGNKPCRVAGLPAVTFYADGARAVPAIRQAPVGMHPGPVVLPVVVPAGGRVATGLRWVSGPVYDRSRSVEVRSVGVTIAGKSLRAPLRATLYGETGRPLTFDQSPLTPRSPASSSKTAM